MRKKSMGLLFLGTILGFVTCKAVQYALNHPKVQEKLDGIADWVIDKAEDILEDTDIGDLDIGDLDF